MIPNNCQNNQVSFRMIQSTLIGLPSPSAIRSDKFPGVRIGSDPVIGNHCIIYGNVFIGDRFRCGDNVLIRDNTSLGDGVSIGNWSFIDSDVVIADHVTIEDEVWVPRSTWIGSHVVIGPGVRFLSESFDACATQSRCPGIILEEGCIIGKKAVISPGVCVGAGARVPDETVVNEDVPPDHHFVNG
jgi:UDP-3-O-[3-hydroxymyristoyl] glucosamine N-acyltransferase